MSKEGGADEHDKQVEMWKVKKLIKSLQAARGYKIVKIHYIDHPSQFI